MERRDDGFSLIETLVVVAVILVLIIVLFPVLRSSRQRANDSGAAAYLREAATYQEQWRQTTSAYTADASDLLGVGLKVAPAGITLVVESGDATGYCMTATHAGGTGVLFKATSRAITRSDQAGYTACAGPE